MLSIGIQQQPFYTVTIPILVGSDFGVMGHLSSQKDVNTSWSGVFAPPANALGLSIKEKDLLFCKLIGIGRWPLPLPSYLCNPVNALGLSIEMRADMRLILWLMEMRPRRKTGSTGLSKSNSTFMHLVGSPCNTKCARTANIWPECCVIFPFRQ